MLEQANGVYRWTYELNLYRNPTALITVLKVLGLSMGLVWLFVVLVSMGDRGFWWDGFLSVTKAFALVMLGLVVLGAISYYLYALIQGGRYCVLFEMDEQGVSISSDPLPLLLELPRGALGWIEGDLRGIEGGLNDFHRVEVTPAVSHNTEGSFRDLLPSGPRNMVYSFL